MHTVKRPPVRGFNQTKTANGVLAGRGAAVFRIRGRSGESRSAIHVEITVDGYVARVVRADTMFMNSPSSHWAMAFMGFRFRWMRAIVNGGGVAAARLANLGTAVGPVIALERPSPSAAPAEGPGSVRWLGGLRFSGWVSADQDPAAMNVLVDGILIDRIRISRWSHVGAGEDARAVREL